MKKITYIHYTIRFTNGKCLQYIDAFQTPYDEVLESVTLYHGMDKEMIKEVTVIYDFRM